MFSYIFLVLSIIPILSREKILEVKNNIYCLILTSLIFSYTTLGLISLVLTFLSQSKFPIIYITITLFLIISLKDKDFLFKYKIIKKFLLSEINNFTFNFKKKNNIFLFLIFVLFLLITISAIGPINHPDALDYHVGYPYQYWINNKFIIDGGIHQGLLGIGDYANIAFIQEKSIWLIRYIQIINLPIILIFLLSRKINKLSLLVFLSSPVFLQWSTIGKPLFLGESSCAISYILWLKNKDPRLRSFLVICIISCLSIKISSLIVCFPIVIHIAYDLIKNYKLSFNLSLINELKNTLYSKEIIISIITLISILFSRQIIINNFAFPLLTGFFNKDNILITKFANEITNYQRDGLFPLNIFFPVKVSDLSSALGPAILIIILLSIYSSFKNLRSKNNVICNVAIFQTILLILFCQGRGDYYCFPLILFTFFSENLNMIKRNKYINFLFSISVNFQLILIICFLSISINQNIQSVLNLNKALKNHSYGYAPSNFINKNTKGNIFYNVTRAPRLYFPKNYISREKLDICLISNNYDQSTCIDNFNITQIVSHPDYLQNRDGFNCQRRESVKGSRNIFNRGKILLEICEKI